MIKGPRDQAPIQGGIMDGTINVGNDCEGEGQRIWVQNCVRVRISCSRSGYERWVNFIKKKE